jgi:AraC family transcriptional regulator of adaptative response / DNA-3-methyladenine glycosylase II
MRIDDDTCYRALAARDSRFDGLFFVGVTSTHIYCRPVCTARVPRRENCRFFDNAALAERGGFRPCLRCRPELAPGLAPLDAPRRTARAAAARIEAGALNNGGSLEQLADGLGLSSRQLRRSVRQEFGVSPIELAQTQRLLLAKQLLTESNLPIIDVAFSSGFDSLRRFNALFQSHYRITPSRMRRAARPAATNDSIRLTLAYRPPLAWRSLLRFLAGRATAGAEVVRDNAYLRTAAIGAHRGWIKVEPMGNKPALAVELATSLLPALPEVLARLKNLFDLSARPDVIADQLSTDYRLAGVIGRYPGLRVPGAFDGFELAIRAILGQRVSVRAASTLSGRLAAKFGETIETPYPGLDRLTPAPAQLEGAARSELRALGIVPGRVAAILALAGAAHRREIRLEPGPNPDAIASALLALPGIGDWTAQYIAMRALRWPDAFPTGDLILLRASGESSTRLLKTTADSWRPWRAYAAMYLWESQHPVDLIKESP